MFKQLAIKIIKLLSPLVIVTALILDGNFIYSRVYHLEINKLLTALTIIGTVAVVIHLIEAIMAFFLAKNQQDNPLFYSIYTFLIGTIGLYELIEKQNKIHQI